MATDIYIKEIDITGEIEQTNYVKLSIAASTTAFNDAISAGRTIGSFNADQMVVKSGTFDSVVYSASVGVFTLYDVWEFITFDQTTPEVVGVGITLPSYYKAGADIKVVSVWSSNTASKVVRFMTGIRKEDSSGQFGQEADTAYIYSEEATGTTWPIATFTHTHDGEGMVAGDNLVILVGREAGHANDDLAADACLRQTIVLIG